MRTLDDETMILDFFNGIDTEEICCFGNLDNLREIHKLLKNINKSKFWVNSSSKSALPPDFYNTKHKLMMEVMRIDDCAYVDKMNKVQNKTLQEEGKVKRKHLELLELGDVDVYIAVSSGLDTDDDHNFDRYRNNFKRVFNKHESKLDAYKRNHPGFKSIFFIFDESTAYSQVEDESDLNKVGVGDIIESVPHVCYKDKYFIDIIKNSKVDYVVWFAPYKLIQYKKDNKINILPLPQCAMFEIKTMPDISENYNHKLMKSVEN